MICIPASFLLYFGVGVFIFILGVVSGVVWIAGGDIYKETEQ
jgi:hypothetical protein